MKKDLRDFLDKAKTISWSDISLIDAFPLSRDSFIQLITDSNIYRDFRKREYYSERIIKGQAEKFGNLSLDVVEKIVDENVVVHLIQSGSFTNIEFINEVAKNKKGDLQVFAAHYCDLDTLKDIRKSRNSKVREIAYYRLGPIGYLDEMLSDKKKDVRIMGLKIAPINYDYISKMTGELSLEAFYYIVSKVKLDDIPLFLGNRNMKNRRIKHIVDRRMSQ